MKIILTNKKDIPFALSNDFKNVPFLKIDLEDSNNHSEMLQIVNKYSLYREWKIVRESTNRVVMESTDRLGNIEYLIINK